MIELQPAPFHRRITTRSGGHDHGSRLKSTSRPVAPKSLTNCPPWDEISGRSIRLTTGHDMKCGRIMIDCVVFTNAFDCTSERSNAIVSANNVPKVMKSVFRKSVLTTTSTVLGERNRKAKFRRPTNSLPRIPRTGS